VPVRVLVVLCVLGFVAAGIATLRVGTAPTLTLEAKLPAIGARTPVTVVAEEPRRGLVGLKLELVQGDRVVVLLDEHFTPRPAWSFWGARTTRSESTVDVGRETVKDLRGGTLTLRATAQRAGTWLRSAGPTVKEITLPVRLDPPRLELLSTQHHVAQGGAEVVVYRVGESSQRDGVRAGTRFFPGFPLPGGQPGERFALFAVRYDLDDVAQVALEATDDVGNTARQSFVNEFFRKPFRADTITVTERFMSQAVPEIRAHTPELADKGDLLANYLEINRNLRQHNADELDALAATSQPKFLWAGPFLTFPNGKMMSAFADRRTYLLDGNKVDQQDHLGFDLASTKHADVPAANSGVVALARYFGIYGNAVVVDHGYGLQSLYAHLSSIEVKPGQSVTRGQVLGHTGETGLAGGDHLHFTILLHGLPTTPAEWWDEHWINDRLRRKLGAALPPSP
jgi:murein DD-endopeptidase MepM/ murein hydrolase activator NlpD